MPQYNSANKEKIKLDILSHYLNKIKELTLKTEGDTKEEIEAELSKIAKLKEENSFNLATCFTSGKTIEEEVQIVLGDFLLQVELLKYFLTTLPWLK